MHPSPVLPVGAAVVISGRKPDEVEAAMAKMTGEVGGADVRGVVADLGTADGCAKLVDAEPAPDILVNNVGFFGPSDVLETTDDEWRTILDVNFMSGVRLSRALVPGMVDRGWGRVVNITSGSVKAPIPQLGLSNSARAGLTGYVAGTSRQVAPFGVNINNLLPGIHDTDRAETLDGGVARAQNISIEDARAQRIATIPARRYGTSADFGAMCAFLCSDRAQFIVGQNILLDGGAINATM